MKKRITVVLEVEDDDEHDMSDEWIRRDIEQEINCASHCYEVKEFRTEIVT